MATLRQRLFEVKRRLLGRDLAGRAVTVLSDDVYLASYPRSGNTWTRFLLANLAYPDTPATFANIEDLIPSIHLFPNRWLSTRPRPRFLKSHEYFDPRYPKVIYVVRDPRDVAVSMYHYCIKREYLPETCPIDQFVPRFIAGEFFNDFATWGEHVATWLAARENSPTFLLLRYEDILEDAVRELSRVAAFLHIPDDPKRLQEAVERSSASQMRSLEKKQSSDWILTRNTRPDKPFVRAAKSGEWNQALAPESVMAIENAWSISMQKLGYAFCSRVETAMGHL